MDFNDHDPVRRKILEEERIMSTLAQEGKDQHDQETQNQDYNGLTMSIPYASATEANSISMSIDIHHSETELVDLTSYSSSYTVPLSSAHSVAVIDGEHLADYEATVLDSKPAALPLRWSYESAEATVLRDAQDHQATWTTHHHSESIFEEIVVHGRDDAEAMVVDIVEHLHPADLDVGGVQAELIGSEYNHDESMQGSSFWSTPEERNSIFVNPNYVMSSQSDEFETSHTIQTGHNGDLLNHIREPVTNVAVAVAERLQHATSHTSIESIFCSEEQPSSDLYQVAEHIQSSNFSLYRTEDERLDAAFHENSYQEVGDIRDELTRSCNTNEVLNVSQSPSAFRIINQINYGHATSFSNMGYHDAVSIHNDSAVGQVLGDTPEGLVIDIEEDLHPGDLSAPSVCAEFLGNDYYRVSSLESSQVRFGSSVSETFVIQDDHLMNEPTCSSTPFSHECNRRTESFDIDVIRSNNDSSWPASFIPPEMASSLMPVEPAILQEQSIDCEPQGIIVDIVEEAHPAEFTHLETRAEFLGCGSREIGCSTELYTSAVSESMPMALAEGIGSSVRVDTGDSEAEVVGIIDEIFQSTIPRSDDGFVRAESVPINFQNAHALLVSTVEPPLRAVSEPNVYESAAILQVSDSENLESYDANPQTSIYPEKEPLERYPEPGNTLQQNENSADRRNVDLPSSNTVLERSDSSTTQSRLNRDSSLRSDSPYHENATSVVSPVSNRVTTPQTPISSQRVDSTPRITNTIRELFFRSETSQDNSLNSVGNILPRTLLPWSVFPSEATGMWVATVNTNQKALDSRNVSEASKALRAFSVPTRKQAEALAMAWTPPRMLPFSGSNRCFICEARFLVFKRPCHCRNCGVCICSSCSVQWPSKMIPDTYNIKNESSVNICKSCDWLCSAFRKAMLDGDFDQAVAIHSTGNVNLVTPFANVKGELFYPVHCAVLGGNLNILQWLVDIHCCPLRSIRIGARTERSSGSFTPILTSRGRSLLGLAMETDNIDMLRYLVVEKRMALKAERDLNVTVLIRILDCALRAVPSLPSQSDRDEIVLEASNQSEDAWRADEAVAYELAEQERRDQNSLGSVDDACIICFANSIDCVVTPCGHQICCEQCSKHISRCPVCGVSCSFMKVFRAN